MKRKTIDPLFPDSATLLEATEALDRGQVIAFPTDTCYGLGADPHSEEACRALYRIKDRAPDQPLILLGSDFSQFLPYCRWGPLAQKLAEKFWPGALTLILPAKNVPSWVNSGGQTIGVRIPDHAVLRSIAGLFEEPLATTSANRSGQPSPRSGEQVIEQLEDSELFLLLDGGRTSMESDSTLIDLSGERPKILRLGGVSPEALHEILNDDGKF